MFTKELGKLLGITESPKFTPRQRETLYGTAYAFYQTSDYARAADIFTLLICYDPFDDRFWKGLASCRQMEKDYAAALRAWSVFCTISSERKEGFFHVSECFLSLGKLKEAEKALTLCEAK